MTSIKKMFVQREMEFIVLFYRWLQELELDEEITINKASFDMKFGAHSWIEMLKSKNKLVDDMFDVILHKDILIAIILITALKEKRDSLVGNKQAKVFLEADKEFKDAVNRYYYIIEIDLIDEYHKLLKYSLSPIGKLWYHIKYDWFKATKTII